MKIAMKIPIAERKWLRVPQAAAIAKTNVVGIRKLIRDHHLRAINFHRYYVIDRLDLEACLQELKSGPQKKLKAIKRP